MNHKQRGVGGFELGNANVLAGENILKLPNDTAPVSLSNVPVTRPIRRRPNNFIFLSYHNLRTAGKRQIKRDCGRSARNQAIVDYYIIKKKLLEVKYTNILLENEKIKLENEKLKLEQEKFKLEEEKLKLEQEKLKLEQEQLKVEHEKYKKFEIVKFKK